MNKAIMTPVDDFPFEKDRGVGFHSGILRFVERSRTRVIERITNVIRKRIKPNASSDDNVHVSERLGEFIGERGGNRGARRKKRGAEAVGVSDDEGDRHGFTERPSQPQHDRPDDACFGIGDDYFPANFPDVRSGPVRGLPQGGRDRWQTPVD